MIVSTLILCECPLLDVEQARENVHASTRRCVFGPAGKTTMSITNRIFDVQETQKSVILEYSLFLRL